MSDTESDACPNCGKRYARRGLSRVEIGAIAVTVVALGVGGAALALGGDDDKSVAVKPKATPAPTAVATVPPHTIRFAQAAELDAKTPYAQVIADLGPPRKRLEGNQKRRLGRNRCVYYDVLGERTDAQLCFDPQDKLRVVGVNYP